MPLHCGGRRLGLGQIITGSSRLAAGSEINAIHGSRDWVWGSFMPGDGGENPFLALANAFNPTLERHRIRPRDMAFELEKDASSFNSWQWRWKINQPGPSLCFSSTSSRSCSPWSTRNTKTLTIRAPSLAHCHLWPLRFLSSGRRELLVWERYRGSGNDSWVRPGSARVLF